MKLTPKRKEILDWAARLDGRLQLLQVTASGGRGHSIVNELCRSGLLEIIDHPTVKHGKYPADALRVTDAGREALAEMHN